MNRKVAFSCFVDAKPKFEDEVVRWLWSLLEKLKVAPQDIYITCDPAVSKELVSFLEGFEGLNIAYEACFTESSKPANKWLQLKRLCEVAGDYTHFIVTDCDKVFVEFSDQWCDDSVRACKFIPRPTYAIFEDIFEQYFSCQPRFTMERPDPHDEYKDGRSYVNNHNGGLIVIPATKLAMITERWRHWIDRLLENPEILRTNLRNLDQVAFAMVMHDIGSDINFLPATFDLGPNISGVSEHVVAAGSGQLVLHVHGQDDDTGRIVCGDKVPQNYRDLIQVVNDQYTEWSARLPSHRSAAAA